ncbi:unnamed protein product [Trichogramma brassicae]|uniref:Uncharacterized protein n=1 Tax=Trichogramma brassicae TaxID=86971 RepID=A0A6H5IJD3_9HYME|nr:unnamed protein product [Trichogramma brassicae]
MFNVHVEIEFRSFVITQEITRQRRAHRGLFERLLVDSLECREGYAFVKFVARSGYRDALKQDENGETILRRATPLHRCAARRSRGSGEILRLRGLVRELFKIYRRFDLNYVAELGMNHLHVACIYSCRTALRRFLELGRVDPNRCHVESTGDSPLHLALDQDHGACEETIRLLLRHGADPNVANLDGRTPLHVICARDAGVENAANSAKLFLDVANDEMGQQQQQQQVRVDARDKWGRTPLQLAVRRGYPARDLMELLLRRGADPNAASAEGLTSLYPAPISPASFFPPRARLASKPRTRLSYCRIYRRYQNDTADTSGCHRGRLGAPRERRIRVGPKHSLGRRETFRRALVALENAGSSAIFVRQRRVHDGAEKKHDQAGPVVLGLGQVTSQRGDETSHVSRVLQVCAETRFSA